MATKPGGFKKSGGYKKSSSGGGDKFTESGIIVFAIFAVIAYLTYAVYFKGAGSTGKVVPDVSFSGFKSSAVVKAAVFVWQYRFSRLYMVFDAILFLIISYSCIKYWPYRTKISMFEKPSVVATKKKPKKDPIVLKHWANIVKKANIGTPENLRLGIMEADALVDYFLKFAGYEGDHMADRLSQILPDEVKSLERLWDAHRLRNDLVHTPGAVVTPQQAQKALMAYYDFLMELDAF